MLDWCQIGARLVPKRLVPNFPLSPYGRFTPGTNQELVPSDTQIGATYPGLRPPVSPTESSRA